MPTPFERPGQHVLSCGTCHGSYTLGDFDAEANYRCARCDRSLTHPSGSYDTLRDARDPIYLYEVPHRQTPAAPTGRMGRYELYEVLGRGGMGVVYRARDPELSRDVALKVLIAAEHAGDDQLDRFLREARAAARIEHPNVVRVLDIRRDEGQAFFTMDLVRGPSLADLVEDLGPRPIREAVRIVAEVGRALHEAHRHDLLHRDVKPGNVLLTVEGVPRLTDFGLVSSTEDVDSRITRTGQVLGTPAYMAPEQATHETDALTPAVDQYALGAVLYELLTGQPPFDGTALEVLMQLVSEPPRPVRQLRGEVPRDLEVVLERAMELDPSRRYASVLAFVEDLERWRRGEPIHARPASLAYRVRLLAWRRRRLLVGVAAGVSVTFALLFAMQQAMAWEQQRRLETREREAAARWVQVADSIEALREAGDDQGADEAFQQFIDEPLHLGTAAVAEAWRHLAEGRVRRGELDDAVDAFGESYVTAVREAEQVAALRGLASAFEAQWRFEALDIVVQTLEDRGVHDAELRGWRMRSALERRNVVEAASWMDANDPRAPLVQAFAQARPLTESRGARWVAPDRRSLLDRNDEGQVRQIGLSPGLPVLQDLGRPPLPDKVLVARTDPLVVVTHDGQLEGKAQVWSAVDTAEGPRLQPGVAWTEARLGAVWDLPQGLLVGVGPYARHLVRVNRGTGRIDHPAPIVDAAASDVMSLATGDLDGDGVEEIVVGSGPWGAYDVRVFEPDWTHRARLKVGVPQDLQVVDGLLFVAESDGYASRQVFPASQPFGDPSAVRVLKLGTDGLEEVARLQNPVPHAGRGSSLSGLVVGDIDGDGRVDVAARSDDDVHAGHTLVWRQLEGGWSEPLVLGDLRVFSGADVDGDGSLELLVDLDGDTQAAWVLGSGTDRVPAIPLRPMELAEPPVVDDAVAARRWDRAEDLVGMGLVEAGAAAIEALTTSTTDATVVPYAYLRAGRLWEAAGDDTQAAARYQAAAADAGLRADALDAATLALERSHAFEEALALTEGRDTPTARSVRERVRPVVAGGARAAFQGEQLLDAFSLHDPVALRWDAVQHVLWADVLADDDPVMTRAVVWDGRRLTLEADLEPERVEWAAGLEVRLADADGAYLGLYLQGWGGGDILEHELGCHTSVFPEPLNQRKEVDSPLRSGTLRFVLDVVPALGQLHCRVEDADGTVLVQRQERMVGTLSGGPWTLSVGPTDHAKLPIPMRATVGLRRVAVAGGGVRLGAPPSTEELVRQAVTGHVEAVSGVDQAGRQAVWQVAALADAGRWEDARLALEDLHHELDDDQRREVLHLLRSRGAVFAPLLSEVVGRDFAVWFDEAWTGALYAHPDDPEVARALTTQLGGLEQPAARPDGEQARMQRVVLLLARARAWAEQGELGAARRDVLAAERDAAEFASGIPTNRRSDVASRVAATHRLLAVREMEGGRRAAALRHARASLEWSPSRDVGLDGLRATELLAALADQL